MAVSKAILGMNARNYLYLRRFNTARAKAMADDKLVTKRRLVSAGIPTTKLIKVFRTPKSVRSFDWKTLPEQFVLKPARGYGGEGILVVTHWNGVMGLDTHGDDVSVLELESAIFDILDGAHSLNSLPDVAFIEDKVEPVTSFKKVSGGGVLDIRVIVCNRVPVMAMLRLPTYGSRGRANLHMGAIGVGVDLRTGITTRGYAGSHAVSYIPGTKQKVRGMKIPGWDNILDIATRSQEVSKLGYAGIDIVLDERYGPLVLEVNARPGLTIQMANGESLRTRLERVDSLQVTSVKRGIDIAKELFAEPVLAEIHTDNHVLQVIEKVTLIGTNGKKKTVEAKIDTGAYRTSIDNSLVQLLALSVMDEQVHVKSGAGQHLRKTAQVTFKLRGKTVSTTASFLNRKHMRYSVIVGRRDLKGFLVDPNYFVDDVR